MKLYQFLMLDEPEQYNTVWNLGKHIETVNKDGVAFMLYAINDFFVEIKYNEHTNEILGKNQFKQGEHLDKYLY